MIDLIASQAAKQIASILTEYTDINIVVRYQPEFEFGKAYEQALSTNNIKQTAAGSKQSLVLMIYDREALRMSDPNVSDRNKAARTIHFKSKSNPEEIFTKGLMTGTFDLNFRVGTPIKDFIEDMELNYLYTLRRMSHLNIKLALEDCADELELFYSLVCSDVNEVRFMSYPQTGDMWIYGFTVNLTGNFFTPQSEYYKQVRKLSTNFYLGSSSEQKIHSLESELDHKQ